MHCLENKGEIPLWGWPSCSLLPSSASGVAAPRVPQGVFLVRHHREPPAQGLARSRSSAQGSSLPGSRPGSSTPSPGRRCHSWGGGGLQDPTLWRLCQVPFSSRICPPLGPRRNLGGPGAPSHIPGGVCVCMCALGGTAMGRPVSRPSPCGLNLPCLLPGTPNPLLSPRWDKDSLGHSSRGRTPPAGQPRTLVLVPGWPGFKSRHGLPSCVT